LRRQSSGLAEAQIESAVLPDSSEQLATRTSGAAKEGVDQSCEPGAHDGAAA